MKKVDKIFGSFKNYSYLCTVEPRITIAACAGHKIFLVHEKFLPGMSPKRVQGDSKKTFNISN